MSDQDVLITRENISLTSFNELSISAGGGINIINSELRGEINLNNLLIRGTMNSRLQTSVFNQFEDQLLNSLNSKCQADQYGAVYGPSYGDTLGTVNCRGAFIGTETTGYIGSTYSATLDVTSNDQLTMPYLVSLQTQSSSVSETTALNNSSNNTAIPMNITSYIPDLRNFTTVSYNAVGNPGSELLNDPYFGNVWAITRDGNPESIPTLANTLTQDLRANTQINISNGGSPPTGNLRLLDYSQLFTFVDVHVSTNMGNLSLSGNIQEDPKLSFDTSLTLVNGNINGNLFIYGGNVFSNLAITGTKTGGNQNVFDEGLVTINSNVNYWNNDFYQYAWHANLINSSITELPPITPDLIQSDPFSGINGRLILQCGTPSAYDENINSYIERPLFDNQFSMMTWTFSPKTSSIDPLLASDFTIGFKYQLYTELRGDFFHFQYSPDAGRTYYDLLKQSGDIKSIKSVALYTSSLWKQVEFYLPGGNNNSKYIFRWIYKKDLGISNGYDIVYLADLFVKYTNPIVVDNNGYTKNYSNEFIGNITTGGSIAGDTAPYLLAFPSNKFDDGYINTFGQTNMDSSNSTNKDMYKKITTYYREDKLPNDTTYPAAENLDFHTVVNNSDDYKNKVWRLNNYITLKSILGYPINDPGYESLLDINATTEFLNGTELALMSSDPNDPQNSTTDTGGLTHGEATYLALGPFAFNDPTYISLTQNNHQLQFRYLPDTENSFDLTGVITYDYISTGQNDTTVKNTLIQLLTFNKSFHLLESDLDLWYNLPANDIIDRSNIKYYPGEEGIYNSSTVVSGWLNFSANIPAMTGPADQKRIYVIYFAKDWQSVSPNNDVVLIHDIKFTFNVGKSSVILDKDGYLYGSDDNNSFKITKVTETAITINIKGFGTKTISLINQVATVPDAPYIYFITTGESGELIVYFDDDPYDGGSPIINYEYSTDNGQNFQSAGTTDSPFTITGLVNGTTYSVRIRAVNDIGNSLSTSDTGTPEAPE